MVTISQQPPVSQAVKKAVDHSRVPIAQRLAWSPEQAAQVYSLDVAGLRYAIRMGDVDTFRPPNRFGKPGRRKITRESMDKWIKSLEE